jgi:hypothetical protein
MTRARVGVWVVTVAVIGLFLAPWFWGKPFSPRGENVPQISLIWFYRALWESGAIHDGWDSVYGAGRPLVVQRGFHLFALLGWLSHTTGVRPERVAVSLQVAAFAASALGACELLAILTGSMIPGLFAGLAFALAPAHLSLGIETLDFNVALAAYPWALVWYERARLAEGRGRRLAVLALGATLAFVAIVSPYMAVLLALAGFPYAVVRELGPLNLRRTLHIGLGVVLTAVGLSAFSFLPLVVEAPELWVSEELRGSIGPEVGGWSLAAMWQALATRLVAPSALSAPAWGFPRYTWYPGIVGPVGALIALVAPLARHRRAVLALAVVLVWSLGLSLSSVHPSNPLFRALPFGGFAGRALTFPFRFLLPTALALALLGGLGMARVLTTAASPTWRSLVALGWTTLLVLDLLPGLDLVRRVSRYLTVDEEAMYRWLDSRGTGRYYDPAALSGLYAAADAIRVTRAPRLNDEYQVSRWGPREMVRLSRTLDTLDPAHPELSVAQQEALSRASVAFVVLHRRDQWEPIAKSLGGEVLWASGESAVVGNPRALPYARVEGSDGVVSWGRAGAGRITASVDVPVPAILTVAEAWYPHWRVTVDGGQTPTLLASEAFLGVRLPAGRHTIVFTYHQPALVRLAAGVTLLTLVTLLVLGWRSIGRTRPERGVRDATGKGSPSG